MTVAVPRVAGVDTRSATATPTVRLTARAAMLVAGPAWLVAFAAPAFWDRWFSTSSAARPWLTVALLLSAIVTGEIAWRMRPLLVRPAGRVIPGGADAALILVLLAIISLSRNDALRAAALIPVPALAGWAIGRAVRLAADAVGADVRSAAAGLVTSRALIGLLITGHLSLVLQGSGPRRAAGWSLFYLTLALVSFARAGRTFAADRVLTERRIAEPDADMPADAALSLRGITVTFGSNTVLRDTSLNVSPGEVVALVGGNGAGKSTLLRVAAGLLTPQTGRTSVEGEDVSELLPEERAAAGIAFVSGARPVFPDLTVLENLRVAGFRTHLTHKSFDQATKAVFALVPRLAERRDHKAGVLSGGEQRLLAVAQTMYRRPKVLLADELSLGLDADARIAVLELLRVLADQGVAIVVVDHDLPALLPRSDRAALLADGLVTDYIPAERVLDNRADLLPATFLAGAER